MQPRTGSSYTAALIVAVVKVDTNVILPTLPVLLGKPRLVGFGPIQEVLQRLATTPLLPMISTLEIPMYCTISFICKVLCPMLVPTLRAKRRCPSTLLALRHHPVLKFFSNLSLWGTPWTHRRTLPTVIVGTWQPFQKLWMEEIIVSNSNFWTVPIVMYQMVM